MPSESIVNKTEFQRRRQRLMKAMGRGSVAIVPAAEIQIRNRDADYPFRQDSDFYYLTGFAEPEAVAVLIPGRKQGAYVLFSRARDPLMETWHGRRAGQKGALEHYGADQAYAIDELDELMPELLDGCDTLYYTLGGRPDYDHQVIHWLTTMREKARAGVKPPATITALDPLLHEQRLFKSKAEVQAMRRAAQVSAQAHTRAMLSCRPGQYEYQVEAELLHEFRLHGCVPAYNSIVGGGENGCILHYVENNAVLKAGDLLLIDAGAEYQHYAGDITRTFPINGRFTPEQRALYDVVLKAQLAAIEQVRPGRRWNDPHDTAVRVLTQGLVKLGLLKGSVAGLIKDEAYRKFYMHRTGHWLGMDVHDVGDYKEKEQWRRLRPGMVLTVEPGLYIAPGSKGVAKRWWGIGIRIEDDVLVTARGCEVLTRGVVKDPDAIEALMARSR